LITIFRPHGITGILLPCGGRVLDWFPWYPADFKRDTYGLSLAEEGAYRRLIDEYMVIRGPLPDDDGALARIIGVSADTWMPIALRVRGYFRGNGQGQLTHKRCDQELRAQDVRFDRHSARGQKAALKRWSKNNAQHARRMLAPNTLTLSKIDSKSLPAEGNGSAELQTILQAKGWTP
jgi:uncharacterized protein YdaU (DUF1376 family)